MIGSSAQEHVNAVAFAGELVPSLISGSMLRKASQWPVLRQCLVSGRAAMVRQGTAELWEEAISLASTVEVASEAPVKTGVPELRRAAERLSELLEGSTGGVSVW
jgi:hypothetical protein